MEYFHDFHIVFTRNSLSPSKQIFREINSCVTSLSIMLLSQTFIKSVLCSYVKSLSSKSFRQMRRSFLLPEMLCQTFLRNFILITSIFCCNISASSFQNTKSLVKITFISVSHISCQIFLL